MEIVKRLSLNRTPKDIPNNSIVCAKNMMIDDTGSFLTQDTAIQKVWECEYGDIVGIIPCNDELVIFTAVPNREGSTTTWSNSKVWRKRDNSSTPVEVICDWEYSGGVINGGCTYNYKNELIVVVAESGASKDVPLKSFIIHDDLGQWKAISKQTYATEEDVPAITIESSIEELGSLVCGTYTFFIRYKVDKDNYTKWFQITEDIIIVQEDNHKPYRHDYQYDTSKGTFGNESVKEPTTTILTTQGSSFKVNKNGISSKSINIAITKIPFILPDVTSFDIQIGYIIKRNDDVQGRILGDYVLTSNCNIVVRDNITIEDINIDEFLESPHQFFNVETATVYNNRLYIANYDEYANSDLSNVLNNVTLTVNEISGIVNKDKTLIPKQSYNIFIHFIRSDGSATPGFYLDNVTPPFPSAENKVYQLEVELDTGDFPEGYIGYFLTYEEVERQAESVFLTKEDGDNHTSRLTNAEYLYDLDNISGDTIVTEDGTYTNIRTTRINNSLIENHIIVDEDVTGPVIKSYIFYRSSNASYNKQVKTLYRLTPNIYKADPVLSKGYTPDYYTTETIIYYSVTYPGGATPPFQGVYLIMDSSASYVYMLPRDEDLNPQQVSLEQSSYRVSIEQPSMYSKYPIYAMNIKQDYIRNAITLTAQKYANNSDETPTKTSNLHLNEFVSPDRLHDLLELKPAYRANPLKIYTNYREDNISRFDKTIYRSDVVSDESLVNGFRHFESNNYKNILENKGKITNIIGIGLYLLVHTEYSLFMFDRSPKLTAKLQSDIPDTFDIDYQEVMPSNQGFGGLQDKKESIVTKNGYVWFDKVNKYIFNFVDGKTEIISRDIHNFIKLLSISKVRFAEDIIHNRLIVCFTLDSDEYITLSYNFNTKTFISAHDYQFTDNYRTYKKSYLVYRDSADSKGINNCLYEYTNNHTATYSGLYDTNNVCIPTYTKDANSSKSFIDIIYNIAPENSKTLISLSYVLNEILLEIYDDNQAEGKHKNPSKINERGEPSYRYSGDELLLYTDETNTGLLDIHVKDNEFNKYAEYRYPIFNKGIWELNYFRNIITTPTEYEEEVQAALELTKPPVLESDPRSLIYGKYIVARFIFNNDTKVKLDNITFNTEAY